MESVLKRDREISELERAVGDADHRQDERMREAQADLRDLRAKEQEFRESEGKLIALRFAAVRFRIDLEISYLRVVVSSKFKVYYIRYYISTFSSECLRHSPCPYLDSVLIHINHAD